MLSEFQIPVSWFMVPDSQPYIGIFMTS
jgi:hypothetical protein